MRYGALIAELRGVSLITDHRVSGGITIVDTQVTTRSQVIRAP